MLLAEVIMLLFSISLCSSENATVSTRLGKIIGYLKQSHRGNNYEAFEGIPYALPPIGDRRFEPPQPISPWTGELQATKLRSRCWGFDREVYPWGKYLDGDEDCLYLNIYRPINKNNSSLPVIFDIHGGAFQYGSALPEAARYLIDHDVIVVTVHYRLGILGFLSTEDDVVSGNMGLKDQAMAIKWVNANIEQFGGDPNKITLTGLSAGGASVHYHYLSPMSRGLFHSGISFSGTALDCWTLAKNSKEKTLELSKLMNCTREDVQSMIQCLKQVPARTLTKAQEKFMPLLLMPFTPFGPVVEKSNENAFIDRTPLEIIESGDAYDVPWITGVVSEEGLYPIAEYIQRGKLEEINKNWESVAPFLLDYRDSVPEEKHAEVARKIRKHYFGDKPIDRENLMTLIQLEGDRIFKIGAEKAAVAQAKKSESPVRFYLYSYRAANSLSEGTANTTENFGVCHGDDVYMVLGNEFIIPSKTEKDMAMHEDLVKLWISVAYKGIPDVGTSWLRVDTHKSDLDYLHIAGPGDIKILNNNNFAEKHFWDSLEFEYKK